MVTIRPCTDRTAWDQAVNALGGHPLQLWGWGEVKSRHRWGVERVLVEDAGDVIGACQILIRSAPIVGPVVLYAPRGPVWAPGRGDDVMRAVVDHAKHRRGMVFTVEPDGTELPASELFRRAPTQILMSTTLIADLTLSEDELLKNMHKKTRYYVRRASKDAELEYRDVRGDEIDKILAIYHETAARAGFALHDDSYYRDIHTYMGEGSRLYAAFVDGEPVAFVWDAISDTTAFWLYGGITAAGQDKDANYGLRWYAMRTSKARGLRRYDMNGLLNEGITHFKHGFVHDHESDELVGSWDVPLSPLYTAYTRALPLAKSTVRGLAKARRGLAGLLRRGDRKPVEAGAPTP